VIASEQLRCDHSLHLKSVVRSRMPLELERPDDCPRFDVDDAPEHDRNEVIKAGNRRVRRKR
jgi:hypothetical protein